LVVGVDVRFAEREQFLRADATEEWGKDEIPVARVDGV
jgi:hypothetical protein